jgi:hypothetical protein
VNVSSQQSAVDRRRFLQIVGLGVSSALTAPAISFAQSAGGTPATPPPAATPPTPPAPSGPPEISEDARSLAEIVRRRYGKHLTPDQIEGVTRELDQRVQGGRRLKDAKLVNSDEPDVTFKA